MFSSCFLLSRTFAFLVCVVAAKSLGIAEARAESPSDWIAELDSPAYHTRESATRSLFTAGLAAHESAGEENNAIVVLRWGLSHESMEVRIASGEILRRIESANNDRKIELLKNFDTSANEIDVPGWEQFSRWAGTDHRARTSFAKLYERFPRQIIDRDGFANWLGDGDETRLDPYRMSPDDLDGWLMVTWIGIEEQGRLPLNLSSRIAMALSSESLGPSVTGEGQVVLARLIGHWIDTQPNAPTARTKLLIAMRYQCVDQASNLVDRMLADSTTSAAAQVMAMLSAAALERDDLQSQLMKRLDDTRTAHVWQLIASRKTKIRTEVRDVALALLLHSNGIDPREYGFDELQADPMLIYRDHSLGFADEKSRQTAHQRGLAKLK